MKNEWLSDFLANLSIALASTSAMWTALYLNDAPSWVCAGAAVWTFGKSFAFARSV